MTKATADIRSLARAQTALAIRTLTGVCSSKAAPAAARVSAASALLDRGWGKAAQPQAGADGEGKIEIVIRDIAEERRQRTMLDAPPVSRCGSSGISSPATDRTGIPQLGYRNVGGRVGKGD